MRIALIILSIVGSALCQEWHGALSHEAAGQISVNTGSRQMRPLWSPGPSSVHQDSWINQLGDRPDHRNTLEQQLSSTSPMVFPSGHEGIFHIPPAPQHLPRTAHGVHSLHQNIQRLASSAAQVTEKVDEDHTRPMLRDWTRTTNVHSWNSPSHQSWPGWPQS